MAFYLGFSRPLHCWEPSTECSLQAGPGPSWEQSHSLQPGQDPINL